MGAGDFPLGDGPAGLDPVVTSQPRKKLQPQPALKVDGLTKDFVLDTDGNHDGAHWVDVAVFEYLRIPQGTVRSAPDHGETVSQIKYIDKQKVKATVQDRARLAVTPLLARNLISILGIDLDTSIPGRIMYVFRYKNLVTAKQKSVLSKA